MAAQKYCEDSVLVHIKPIYKIVLSCVTDKPCTQKHFGFVHPNTGEQMDFTSELPNDLANVIEKWRNYIMVNKNYRELLCIIKNK